MTKIKNPEWMHQTYLIEHTDLFDHKEGGGKNDGKGPYPHILKEPEYNLYSEIRQDPDVKETSWWKGTQTGDTVSSQISCINHLWPIAKNKSAVMAIINGAGNHFRDVLPLRGDRFIDFEVKGPAGYLNEKWPGQPTQIDAVIIARTGKANTLIVFEWKYTEQSGDKDMSVQDKRGEQKGLNSSGIARMNSYTGLIDSSLFLKSLPDYQSSIYYLEPFYQLMRQTLWASNMIEKSMYGYHIADYLHIHVISDQNRKLLNKKYPINENYLIDRSKRGGTLKETWNSTLTDAGRERYKLVSPEKLFAPLAENPVVGGIDYTDLIEYLRLRYW